MTVIVTHVRVVEDVESGANNPNVHFLGIAYIVQVRAREMVAVEQTLRGMARESADLVY